MKICAYRVIQAHALGDLDRIVNEAAEQGFIPCGGVTAVQPQYSGLIYIQAVARIDIAKVKKLVSRKRK